MLLEANKELILDHYQHTTRDMNQARVLINEMNFATYISEIKLNLEEHVITTLHEKK